MQRQVEAELGALRRRHRRVEGAFLADRIAACRGDQQEGQRGEHEQHEGGLGEAA